MRVSFTRIEAKKKLNYFVEKKLIHYSKLRNFITDNQNQLTTSCLSPYITHGILTENEVINESLKKLPFSKCEKFIEEILWRVYWRGWLELRPELWKDYITNHKKINEDLKNNSIYKSAIDGKTDIQCFNDWVIDLKENNYLHNHVRMWFASIWIFTLNLPWELGAAFFIKHLYDGDIASNTLSWRWVAGMQTKGKNYLAKEWNIRKFTNEKYNNIKINETALPLNSNTDYPMKLKEFKNPKVKRSENLLIFDNSLSFELKDNKNNFKKIFIVINNKRQISLSKNVINLKNHFIEDQINRLDQENIKSEIINIDEINKIGSNFYALYPCIGENLDFIKSYNSKEITFLYRGIDQYSWKYCDKGFFNFKKNIPNIIKNFC
tara:strand:+ start:283 stop:1419 length:1137 start_codon:yes stop_codon:yes gene_type:complete